MREEGDQYSVCLRFMCDSDIVKCDHRWITNATALAMQEVFQSIFVCLSVCLSISYKSVKCSVVMDLFTDQFTEGCSYRTNYDFLKRKPANTKVYLH